MVGHEAISHAMNCQAMQAIRGDYIVLYSAISRIGSGPPALSVHTHYLNRTLGVLEHARSVV